MRRSSWDCRPNSTSSSGITSPHRAASITSASCYEGFLYPFGHRASLVKITERKVLAPDGGAGYNPASSPVAYLRQRMYIIVRERAEDLLPSLISTPGREMPLASLVRVKVR